ncbi:single-stranded DNA-binding protein [Burkholderia multivorans]|uniref:single-stranded DNA-binding protein n=1 Tax=Burkholderia multivorans TaxID=87883 RepID=UPI00159217B0|nr:single-stranded DNA-binding protein [Burkholderia multivorans]MCA7958043.1 single-stranded DNA-binding protein [Burkholderia multivorans]
MIDGLVSGRLYGTATSRTGASGKAFVTAKVRAAAGDGESLFVNVIAFDDTAKSALLALGDGDSVALAGTLTPKAWVDRAGEAKPALDLVAHAVLSAYDVKRRRAAVQATRQPANGAEQARRMYGGAAADFDDDL